MNNILDHQFSLQKPSKLSTITFHFGPDPIYRNKVALIKTAPASAGANLKKKYILHLDNQIKSSSLVLT